MGCLFGSRLLPFATAFHGGRLVRNSNESDPVEMPSGLGDLIVGPRPASVPAMRVSRALTFLLLHLASFLFLLLPLARGRLVPLAAIAHVPLARDLSRQIT